MATTPTTNRAYGKPTDQGSSQVWGVELNAFIDAADVDVHKLLTTAGFASAGGTGDVLTATLDPAPASYVEGMWARIKITADNTTAPTINLNALGAKTIKAADGSTLVAGALKTGAFALIIYNGTDFLLQDAPKATTAETLLGTSAVKAATPAGLAGLFTTSSSVHVLKLPGGYMIQAGRYSGGASSATITFPVAFTESPFVTLTTRSTGATTTSGSGGSDGQVGLAALNGDPTTTGFSIYVSTEGEVNDVFNATVSGRKVDWIAAGKVATS